MHKLFKLTMRCILTLTAACLMNSCGSDNSDDYIGPDPSGGIIDSNLPSGIYVGIIGFNQSIYKSDLKQLTSTTVNSFNSFINSLTMKDGTILYYSVDQALNALNSAKLPADVSTVALVTFTDGLDQGSMMMQDNYTSNWEYLEHLNYRIREDEVVEQHITAYSIGLLGSDVTDKNSFNNNLKNLASTAGNAFPVTDMSQVTAKFKDIAESLSQTNTVQTISLKMPGLPDGTRVRFTLDDKSPSTSAIYIEGIFNIYTKSLENVEYHGLTSTSDDTVKGIQDGIFVKFKFEKIITKNGEPINGDNIREYTYQNYSWQVNSEFNGAQDSQIVNEVSSAVIMLVLDCSSSLGSDFVKVQDNAKDFINILYKAVGKQKSYNESN